MSFLGLAVYFDRRTIHDVSFSTLRNPNAGSLNPLDVCAFKVPDARAGALADIGLYGGPTLPLLLSLHPRSRPHYPVILVVWLETILLNFAITSAIKNRFSRPRPYVLGEVLPHDQVLTRNDRAAFLSGHTSSATAGSLLFAFLVQDYAQNRIVIAGGWFLAGAVAGFTAYLRVKAAKHWPTDAVAGVILGGAVATLVLRLHQEPAP